MSKRDEDKPLADRRAEADAPQDEEPDFAEEHPRPHRPADRRGRDPGRRGRRPQSRVP